MKTNKMPVWYTTEGEKVSCTEKIKVMQQNLEELEQMAQDLFEDGVLMEVDPKQLKAYLHKLVDELINPYK